MNVLAETTEALEALDHLAPGRTHWRGTSVPGVVLSVGREVGYAWSSVTPTATASTVWSTGGARWFAADGAERFCAPDTLMLLDRGAPHRGEGLPRSNYVLVWFAPEAAGLEGGHLPTLQTERGCAARAALCGFAAAVVARGGAEAERAAWARFSERLRGDYVGAGPGVSAGRRADRAVREATRLLRERFREPLPLAALAAAANLSRFELARRFRAEVGLPPHRYQLHLRLNAAAGALAAGARVSEAAADAGFADAAHLSRAFRRQYGTSPAAWRELTRTDRGDAPESRVALAR